MRRYRSHALAALSFALLLLSAAYAPRGEDAAPGDLEVGEQAPAFTLESTSGTTYTLAELRGKFVVMEWLNFDCPYTRKHYESGNMPHLQAKYAGDEVVWLSISSSAPGKPGHYPPDVMNARNEQYGGEQTAILMDPAGEVGRAYGARTTPHMFVIDRQGTVIYMGGIDDRPTADTSDIKGATNHVDAALQAALHGKEVEVETAPPYGCHIPYAAQ